MECGGRTPLRSEPLRSVPLRPTPLRTSRIGSVPLALSRVRDLFVHILTRPLGTIHTSTAADWKMMLPPIDQRDGTLGGIKTLARSLSTNFSTRAYRSMILERARVIFPLTTFQNVR